MFTLIDLNLKNRLFKIIPSLILLFFLGFTVSAKAQNEIAYSVSFKNAMHHEAEIAFTITNLPSGPLKVRMARSSTGRYATHEFGKNVYNVKAADLAGNPVKISKIEGDVYQIASPGKAVTITYTLFGNWVDGTYAAFDRDFAHMNMAATFMYPIGLDNRPRTLQLNYADKPNWKVVTQLQDLGKGKYFAKDFQYFMDSPVNIGTLKSMKWDVTSPDGKQQTIQFHTNTKDAQPIVDNFGNLLKKMVDEQIAVFGELPTFDYGNFYFMQNVNPENAGDGMEHRNSTVIVERDDKIEGNESDMLSTFSHEFFHAWNVERLRPKTLEPFDFSHANMSDGLWISEGFTQYYGQLLLKRAGLRSLDEITRTNQSILNTVLLSPGALNYSPIESSQYAVFADAGVAVDQTNKGNMFTSYYVYGAGVALALDLRLRADFNLTLDDYMRALWKEYGKPEIPFTMEALQKTLGNLTKNNKFAEDFFSKYIHGTAKEDYKSLLEKAGFILQKARPGKAFTGFGRVNFSNGKAILGATQSTSPAYKAGLNIGNVLLKINDQDIKSQADLNKIMDASKPGDQLKINFTQRGLPYETTLTLSEDPTLELITFDKANRILTPEIKSFRDNWLNSKIKQ